MPVPCITCTAGSGPPLPQTVLPVAVTGVTAAVPFKSRVNQTDQTNQKRKKMKNNHRTVSRRGTGKTTLIRNTLEEAFVIDLL